MLMGVRYLAMAACVLMMVFVVAYPGFLQAGGVKTTGRVVELPSSADTHSSGDDYLLPGRDPIVEFVTEDGRTIRSLPISCAPIECWPNLHVGDQVPIVYQRGTPKLVHADTPRSQCLGIGWGLLIAGAGFVSAWMWQPGRPSGDQPQPTTPPG